MKYAIALLLLVFLTTSGVVGQNIHAPDIGQTEENLQDLIEEALSRNPEIASTLYRMDASRLRIPQTGALPDPELNFKLMEIPGTDLGKAMYANVELMQMIPFPSKLSGQRAIGELLSEHAHHDHMESVLSTIAELKTALAMLWFARESQTINESNKGILKNILKAAETGYSVGKTSQQEVLRTSIELSKLSVTEGRIREQIITAESSLRQILNRPAAVPIGRFDFPVSPSTLPTIDQLLEYARQNRPMLIHDSLNVLEKVLTVGLMKKEFLPDFKFSLEYVRMPVLMENRWSVSAGISLPFAPWSIAKTSSKVQEAEAEQQMISSMFESSRNTIERDIRSQYAGLEALDKEIRTISGTILPQLQQSIQLLLTEYENGKTSYLMLLDGYRMYNDMKLDYAMARMKYQETLAQIERSVGASNILYIVTTRKDDHQ